MEEGVLRELLQSQRGTELVRGMLQTMRDTSLDAGTTKAREGIEGRSDAWIHMQLGRAASLEDMVRHFVEMTVVGDGEPATEDEAMLGEVPRK